MRKGQTSAISLLRLPAPEAETNLTTSHMHLKVQQQMADSEQRELATYSARRDKKIRPR